MSIDFSIVLSVVVGVFIYNIILRAIGNVILTYFLKTDVLKKEKESFQDKLKKKMEEVK